MDQKIKDHFVFCFPYRGSGGVPLLFLRLAKELSKQNYKITLIDYKDGFMTENIPKKTKINIC